MYDNRVHSVPDRIVSISQLYIRPIVRGKAAAPVEFGAKLDQTTRSSIALSVMAMNVDQIYRSLLRLFFDIVLSRFKQHNFMLIFIQNTHEKELVSC